MAVPALVLEILRKDVRNHIGIADVQHDNVPVLDRFQEDLDAPDEPHRPFDGLLVIRNEDRGRGIEVVGRMPFVRMSVSMMTPFT